MTATVPTLPGPSSPQVTPRITRSARRVETSHVPLICRRWLQNQLRQVLPIPLWSSLFFLEAAPAATIWPLSYEVLYLYVYRREGCERSKTKLQSRIEVAAMYFLYSIDITIQSSFSRFYCASIDFRFQVPGRFTSNSFQADHLRKVPSFGFWLACRIINPCVDFHIKAI